MRRPRPKTIFDDLGPLTNEERRAYHELALREYPKHVVDALKPAQRKRFRELLRRQREQIPEAMVREVAAMQLAVKKHGYLKRTSGRLGISPRRVAQIVKKDSSKRTQK
jgi:hypothetical protein